MNCPSCQTINDNNNMYCISCGATFLQPSGGQYNDPPSMPTAFHPSSQINPSIPPNYHPSVHNFDPLIPNNYSQPAGKKSRLGIWLGLAFVLLLLLVGGGIGGAIFLMKKTPSTAETLPDHLGIFFQNPEKTNVEEIKKLDFTKVSEGKEKLLKDDTLPTVTASPNLILYSDSKDIPLGDLKLVQLDSINDKGTLKQIDFQAVPVEGKTDLKRLKIPDGLANGKYALAVFDGFFDDGKHKFWAFQVKNSEKTENNSTEITLARKSKQNDDSDKSTPKPTPKPTISAPVGARVAYCNTNNVVVRGSPSLQGAKIGALKRGEKVFVMEYSTNYDNWNGIEANWAYIQKENGARGWVFTPFISL